jgi:glutathione S-transferase
VLLQEQSYLGGMEYGLADIALVPWFLRVRDMLGVELDGFPALVDWLARLEERPAIAAEAGIVAAL